VADHSRNRRVLPVTLNNSTVNGGSWARHHPETWARLDFTRAWIDPGLGDGPYLKVPYAAECPLEHGRDTIDHCDGVVYRVRPADTLGARYPERRDGVWRWMPARSVEEATKLARAGREAMADG